MDNDYLFNLTDQPFGIVMSIWGDFPKGRLDVVIPISQTLINTGTIGVWEFILDMVKEEALKEIGMVLPDANNIAKETLKKLGDD